MVKVEDDRPPCQTLSSTESVIVGAGTRVLFNQEDLIRLTERPGFESVQCVIAGQPHAADDELGLIGPPSPKTPGAPTAQ